MEDYSRYVGGSIPCGTVGPAHRVPLPHVISGAPIMTQDIVSELAPRGSLRAGINMANILLVTGSTSVGEPTGVAPDMARAIADRLRSFIPPIL